VQIKLTVVNGPIEYAGVTYRTGDLLLVQSERDAKLLELIGKVKIASSRRSKKVTMEMRADAEGDNAAPYNTRETACDSSGFPSC